MNTIKLVAAAAMCLVASAQGVFAQSATEFRMTYQPGIAYLAFHVMADQKLLEKHSEAQGLGEIPLTLVKSASPAGLTDNLLSGSVDGAAAGATVLLSLWDKTSSDQSVRGISSIANTMLRLNTLDPNLNSLKDLGPNDKISVTQTGTSVGSVLLRMQSKKKFGDAKAIDRHLVSLPNVDAAIALNTGSGIVNTSFISIPFGDIQLKNPNVRTILKSTDIVGSGSSTVVYTTQKFYSANEKLITAFIEALDEAQAWINQNHEDAIKFYLKMEPNPQLTPADFVKMLEDGDIRFNSSPDDVMSMARFMHEIGVIRKAPENESDVFFPINSLGGAK